MKHKRPKPTSMMLISEELPWWSGIIWAVGIIGGVVAILIMLVALGMIE